MIPRSQPVLGWNFYLGTEDQLIELLLDTTQLPQPGGVKAIVTANVDHIVLLEDDDKFNAAYESAWIITADGMPVYLYAKLQSSGIQERITGADLFHSLMDKIDPEVHRPFLVVNTEANKIFLDKHLSGRGFPSNAFDVVVPPFGFENDHNYSDELARKVMDGSYTHLIFGLGAPKSEIWINKYSSALGNCYALSVGAGVDFYTGQKSRAPKLVSSLGMEWFWRFLSEPRRLFKRYFVDSWKFFRCVRRNRNLKN